jgi:hypothetical protein
LGWLEQAEVLNFARSHNIDSKLGDFHFVVFLEDAVEVVGTPESILRKQSRFDSRLCIQYVRMVK